MGSSVFFSSGDVFVGGTSCVAYSVSSTLWRLKREGGISLEMLQRKGASSRVEGRISWGFSIPCRKLVVPLELRR